MKLRVSWGLFIPILILSVFSLVSIYSIDNSYFNDHLINIIIGIFVFLGVSQIDLKPFRGYYRGIYIVSVALLILLVLIGDSQRGAVRWFNIFGVSIQLSEVLKPFLLYSLAGYLSIVKKDLRHFIYLLVLIGVLFGLNAYQPDLGNALIYMGTGMGVMLFAGFSYLYFLGLIVIGVLSTPIWIRLLHDYQINRILTFIDPGRDPLGTTYNVTQAVIAIGSGLIFGKGFFQNTQSSLKFLPERHTDFIFAGISETFGLIGASFIIICFLYLLYKLIMYCRDTEDEFVRLFVAGAFVLLSIHVVFNIGMNLGILPVVGITLPFVSYGGSSILANFLLLGIVSSLTFTSRANILEIK